MKENITSTDDLELDKQDSSVTRSMSLLRQIFDKANLECYRVVKQQHFPKGLFSVYMFILKPKIETNVEEFVNILDNKITIEQPEEISAIGTTSSDN